MNVTEYFQWGLDVQDHGLLRYDLFCHITKRKNMVRPETYLQCFSIHVVFRMHEVVEEEMWKVLLGCQGLSDHFRGGFSFGWHPTNYWLIYNHPFLSFRSRNRLILHLINRSSFSISSRIYFMINRTCTILWVFRCVFSSFLTSAGNCWVIWTNWRCRTIQINNFPIQTRIIFK